MSIKISVKLIATLREKLPEGTKGNTCDLEVSKDCSIQEVLNLFKIPLNNINVVLVNGHVPSENQILKDGDSVCAFPAIAGGQETSS